MPKVSILMTSYNHEKYIRESIESILAQTFTDFELIIVDDYSTDKSFDIISSYKDDRITAIRNEQNKGPEYAFEILHKTAKGKFIAIADSDNVWEKDKLQKEVEFLEKHPKYTAVFTRANIIDEFSNPYTDENSAYYNVFNVENRSRQEWLKRFFYQKNCLCHPSIVIRKEAYKECGMIVNGLWQVPDFYKWIKLCLKKEIYVLEDKLINFRVHRNNISGEFSAENILRGNNELYRIYELFYEISEKDFPLVFDEAEQFVVDGKINTKFALSKILLKHEPAAQALGLRTLFGMLNNEKERKQIFELYKYDDVSYKKDETLYSPFVPTGVTVCRAKLYFDFGSGFNEEDTAISNFIPNKDGEFCAKFDGLNELCKGKTIKNLRFDPCESCAKIKIMSMISGERDLEFRVAEENYPLGKYIKNGEYDIFCINDPVYIISSFKKGMRDLSVSGEILVLNDEQIEKAQKKAVFNNEVKRFKLKMASIKEKTKRIAKLR